MRKIRGLIALVMLAIGLVGCSGADVSDIKHNSPQDLSTEAIMLGNVLKKIDGQVVAKSVSDIIASETSYQLSKNTTNLIVDLIEDTKFDVRDTTMSDGNMQICVNITYRDTSKVMGKVMGGAIKGSVSALFNKDKENFIEPILKGIDTSIKEDIDVARLPIKNRNMYIKFIQDTGEVVISKDIIHMFTGDKLKGLESIGLIELKDIVLSKEDIMKLANVGL